jgi:hypothetical protein
VSNDDLEVRIDECEVCSGRHGVPVITVTFAHDTEQKPLPVRMCQVCMEAVFAAMTKQWNDAVAANNAEVDAFCRLLGIEPSWPS